ncbi:MULTISPECIES: LysR family transcriptional regulator [Pseudomonas]|uniref:LysR family transcriptional regulator n=1 Tax=Pseudomonas TaxID=286 RepID=UPI0009E243AB|nr:MULTISPECIES: LysR family transcriptional regulator [Pseudomonas]
MELRHLRYFVVVAEEQSMTRAARRLGIQQPPLSIQIRNLERELEVELFDRSPRKVQLNETGRSFLYDAQAILEDAEQAIVRVRQIARGERGRIVVGYTSAIGLHGRIPDIVKIFNQKFPDIIVVLEEVSAENAFEAVTSNSLDALFTWSTAASFHMLKGISVSEERMVLAIPKESSACADNKAINIFEINNQDFYFDRNICGKRVQDFFANSKNLKFLPRAFEDVSQLLSVLAIVAAGKGIALVPKYMEAFYCDNVCYKDLLGDSILSVPLNFYYFESSQESYACRFAQVVSDIAQAQHSVEKSGPERQRSSVAPAQIV